MGGSLTRKGSVSFGRGLRSIKGIAQQDFLAFLHTFLLYLFVPKKLKLEYTVA
jgi:hypothetical protein